MKIKVGKRGRGGQKSNLGKEAMIEEQGREEKNCLRTWGKRPYVGGVIAGPRFLSMTWNDRATWLVSTLRVGGGPSPLTPTEHELSQRAGRIGLRGIVDLRQTITAVHWVGPYSYILTFFPLIFNINGILWVMRCIQTPFIPWTFSI